ncbi:gephyrin-like molybdotransferase Glp [Patulibacter sp.]|uniref:molybdopterin molybdotransferase MoeA n=1 Tax=Patulibacter sp. TaxID=1912859 RepID=UPI002719C30B|nr:gephyrin-like molybdotransferase Glp [Patulibacter sp.]MDO9408050.1 molybdopterin molybdotransferase MoeA [Patulibacter sp.]
MGALSSLDDARTAAAALGGAARTTSERVPIVESVGRIASDDVVAGGALPPFASSAMDGWAVRAADLAGATADRPVVLRGTGESAAGRPSAVAVEPGTAMRISTGARIPDGADAVVRVEETSVADGGVAIGVAVRPGRDVRRAGEDVAHADVAVRAGERLGPGHVALLAGLGVTAVDVRARPRTVVVITGDEVVPGGAGAGGLPDGRIHDVGGPALAALLAAAGARVVAVRHVGDDAGATTAALADIDADLVVTCGGMSVGEHDHVRRALAALGADEHVIGLELQPGRPTWLGALPGPAGTRPVLALPGNPGAAITVATLLVEPLLRAMAGGDPATPLRARLLADTHGDARRVRALRVALGEDADGRRTARVLEGQQPHRLASMPATVAYALIPAADGVLAAGTVVEVVPLPGAGRD